MANTITVLEHPIAGKKVAQVGLVRLTTVSTETYATASAGFTLDLAATLTALGIAVRDVLAIIGTSANGHTAKFTQTATPTTYTVRLWDNAGSEIADGAINESIETLVFFSAGSAT
jgi:hypothetical protein